MQTLILKSLDACNLCCAYCSLGHIQHPKMMTEETMQEALHFFALYVRSKGENKAYIIFHGGEPMLIPAAQYAQCIRKITEDFPEIDFRFSMQTNGTLMTAEYLDFIQAYDIHIGISLDGNPNIHDGQRRDSKGQKTYSAIMQNIQHLQENNIPVSALMVLTKPALTIGLDFLLELDRLHIPLKINPLLPIGNAVEHSELTLSSGDYGRYLAKVFSYIIKNRLKIHISPLEDMIYAIFHKTHPRGCQYDPCCCEKFLCINANGDLYPCGRFADISDYKIGNLEIGITPDGRSILDKLNARRTYGALETCKKCKYFMFCNSGCNADHLFADSVLQPCIICEDQRYIFHYLRTTGMELVKQELLQIKNELYI